MSGSGAFEELSTASGNTTGGAVPGSPFSRRPGWRLRCPDVLVRRAVRRARGVLDLPDLPGERDHVRGVPDEFDRGRPVQGVEDGAERAVPVHLHEAAGARRRRSTRRAATEAALREGVEIASAAELHVDEEWGTGGHLSGAG
jgi:hypothetical protein